MLRFSSAALRQHQEIVREIYTLSGVQEFAPRVARLLSRLIEVDCQGSASMNYATQQFEARREPALDDAEQERLNAIFLQHVEIHPLATQPHEVVQGTTLTLSQSLGKRAFENSGLFHEFYRTVGSRDELAMSVPCSGSQALCFFLWRNGLSFRANEVEHLELIRPHVEQAWRNVERYAAACGGASLVEDLSAALGRGLVLLDTEGRVREWSDCGRHLVQLYFPDWRAEKQQLPDPLRRWAAKLLAENASGAAIGSARKPFEIQGAAGRLAVRLVNRRTPGEYLLLFEEHRDEVPVDCLRSLGLTPRECVIASWVAQGKTTPEIATILGANPLTIKVHLTHIFEKLGVETRTAAALRIAEVSRDGQA